MEHIRFEHITKTFGSVVANHDVSFSLEKGEVLSILGENGSGKTTLLNVLAGIYEPDDGKIYIDGEQVVIKSPKDAFAHHIGMVHQHYKLVDAFTAVENMVLGLSNKDLAEIDSRFNPNYKKKRLRVYTLKDCAKLLSLMCERFGFVFDPNKHVYDMSISEKQTLEIIKILFRGAETLVLDEPTAVLTPQEIKHLFDVIRKMKQDGKTVIIITHKLNEVLEISDRVAILRKGEYVGTVPTTQANESLLADMMVGKKVDLDIHRSEIPNTGVRLSIRNLSVPNGFGGYSIKDVSFDVMGSEILGIAGISGSGQKELLDAIAGLATNAEGEMTFINPKKDQPVTFFHKDIKQIRELAQAGKFYTKSDRSPCDLSGLSNREITKMVENEEILFYEDEVIDLTSLKPIEIRDLGVKLSFVPEDRLGMGLVGDMNIIDNMLLRSYRKGHGRMLRKEKSKELAEEIVKELDIKTPSLQTEVSKLSGGNIQKVLVGRELSSRPKVLMAAYPVRGLDINSSYTIYHLLDEQKKKGTAVIYVGEDLDVLLALADRILVLCDGKVSGIVKASEVSKEEVGIMMTSSAA